MAEEILNIEYNIKRMIVRRLNKFNKLYQVASSLGISERRLSTYREIFHIEKCPKTNRYFIKEKK